MQAPALCAAASVPLLRPPPLIELNLFYLFSHNAASQRENVESAYGKRGFGGKRSRKDRRD
jgi:hypothetical protein